MADINNKKFYRLREAAKFLEMDWRTFKRYVDSGMFPQGVPVIGSKAVVWHHSDLRHMEWIYRNHERFRADETDEQPAKKT